MVQSDDVASYVFPCPVMCCQLTKMGILVRNVVTGIVLRMVEPGVGEGGSYLDGVEVFMWREGCWCAQTNILISFSIIAQLTFSHICVCGLNRLMIRAGLPTVTQ